MARPREFDEDAALDAAMQCFWSQGFEATSVRDLAEHMGLTNASLYNAFGDKRALYRRVLDHYLDQSLRARLGRYEGRMEPKAAIEAFFREIVERSLDDRQRRGCLLVNSALEVAPHDAEFKRTIGAALREAEGFFRRCVTAGQAAGTIAERLPADDLARMLLALLLGLRVLARSRPERALLTGLVRPALAMLEP